MKTFIKTMLFVGVFLSMQMIANAQCNNTNAQSFTVKTADGVECVRVNYDENNGILNMSMNFPREKTTELKNYLVTELGKNYTTHTGDLQRWTNLKNTKPEGFKVSLSNGYIKISYTGEDEDVMEEVKALVREVKYKMQEELK